MKTIVIHRVTSSKFGNRMKYTKEKTGPYHTSFSHFLCHCITDFFLSVDIQIVSLVIYARFLYHYSITTLSLCLVLILVDCVLKKSCYRLSINVKKQTILS